MKAADNYAYKTCLSAFTNAKTNEKVQIRDALQRVFPFTKQGECEIH